MYTTPRACYERAPVRRETPTERRFRHCDQVPFVSRLPILFNPKSSGFTINKGLRKGKPVFYKEVTQGAR